MKYAGMPCGMWLLFAGSFRKQLTQTLKYDAAAADGITARARLKYREVIGSLPESEKADRFRMNIVNCALFSAFLPRGGAADFVREHTLATGGTYCDNGFRRKKAKS